MFYEFCKRLGAAVLGAAMVILVPVTAVAGFLNIGTELLWKATTPMEVMSDEISFAGECFKTAFGPG